MAGGSKSNRNFSAVSLALVFSLFVLSVVKLVQGVPKPDYGIVAAASAGHDIDLDRNPNAFGPLHVPNRGVVLRTPIRRQSHWPSYRPHWWTNWLPNNWRFWSRRSDRITKSKYDRRRGNTRYGNH